MAAGEWFCYAAGRAEPSPDGSVGALRALVQYAYFDPRAGILRIASAGMEGPVILSAHGCRELELRGIPPGMFPETIYENQTVQLERGDSVIFLSDGFSESQNAAGDFF